MLEEIHRIDEKKKEGVWKKGLISLFTFHGSNFNRQEEESHYVIVDTNWWFSNTHRFLIHVLSKESLERKSNHQPISTDNRIR